jgi:hypothetical protein
MARQPASEDRHMPYAFQQAKDPLAVADQQVATASDVRFTPMAGNLGLLARVGELVTGVHLTALTKDGQAFDFETAYRAVKLLGPYSQVVVLGFIEAWRDTGVAAPFDSLMLMLRTPMTLPKQGGSFGGRMTKDGVFEIYEAPKQG